MFKKLHLQLTFFCTLVTGLILVSMTTLCLYIVESGMNDRSYTSFVDNLNTMLAHFESQSTISHQWILQMEANYHIKLNILDNDTPLFSQQLNNDEEISVIFEEVAEKARTDYDFNDAGISPANILARHIEFKMKGSNGQKYYASVALIPKDNGYLNVTVLYPLDSLEHDIMVQRTLFGLLDLLAVGLLTIFSWHFTKRMIHPIKESRERQVQFIAAASHELRSPLTVILTSLSAMKVADKKQSEQFADSIQSEGQRMSRLIDDMLTLANADNRTWSIHPSDIELDTLLLQTYEKYERIARDKGLTLDVDLPEDIPPTYPCDGERVAQVLSILIDNAMSYTPKGGKIKLGLKTESSRIQLYVADNGPGVPDESKKSIFDRFYRVDKAHKDKAHFGLGLCIAKEIVKLHKGKIAVEDTPGGGATFIVTLPQTS